jgi:hypothetical protein
MIRQWNISITGSWLEGMEKQGYFQNNERQWNILITGSELDGMENNENNGSYETFRSVDHDQMVLLYRLISTQGNYPWIGTDKKIFLCLVSSGLELMTLTQRKCYTQCHATLNVILSVMLRPGYPISPTGSSHTNKLNSAVRYSAPTT